MRLALVGAGERWKQGDLANSALVGDRQRWPAMIQVLLQLSGHFGILNSPLSANVIVAASMQ